MTDLVSWPCPYPNKQAHIVDLLIAYRAATSVHIYPTAWRLRLLWSSRVWEPALDTRLWENESGRAAGFALFWRRHRESPYLALERVIHPMHVTDPLVDAMLAWAVERAQTIAAGQATPLTFFTNQLHPAIHPDRRLETYGFAPVEPDPEQYNVYLTRELQTSLPEPSFPPGYTLRTLQAAEELEAYAAMYGFAAVNMEHHQEMFASDEYSHLVVVAPDGDFVAYGECSICRAEWLSTGQRVGWIDYIETRPEHQQRGFGHAVLLACLRQLREWGAKTAMLITVSTNTSALKLYETTGFTPIATPEMPGYSLNLEV